MKYLQKENAAAFQELAIKLKLKIANKLIATRRRRGKSKRRKHIVADENGRNSIRSLNPMVKHPEQRVGILVDVSNIYHSAKNLYGKKANFKEILSTAVAGRKLIEFSYAIKTETERRDTIF